MLVVICSCGEATPEKRVYTEKDLEGYWATYTTLHPSTLADLLADSNAVAEKSILRFYNEINGLSDSTYFVRGDSLFIVEYEGWAAEIAPKYKLKYRIRFVSHDRLELWELQSGQFITYYSIFDLPQRNTDLVRLEVNPFGREGFVWSEDSLNSTLSLYERGCYFGVPAIIHMSSDSVNFSRINRLYKRVNLDNEMLEFRRMAQGLPPSAPLNVNLVGGKRSDYLPISPLNVDPCLLAIKSECDAIAWWIQLHGK